MKKQKKDKRFVMILIGLALALTGVITAVVLGGKAKKNKKALKAE